MTSERTLVTHCAQELRTVAIFVALLVFFGLAGLRASADSRDIKSSLQPVTTHTEASLLSVPLSFEPNQGQTDRSVKFLARGDGYALFLTPREIVLQLKTGSAAQDAPAVLHMELLGASGAAQFSGGEKLSGTVNYFMGNDPRKWRSGLPVYGKVNYRGIYPGVDAVFYGNQRELEYDFTVAPGADAKQIALVFSGAKPKLDGDGNIILSLNGDNVMLHKPVIYQGDGANRKSVEGSYVVAGNRVDFRIGPYDHSQALVIDPVISYLTYLGGSTGNNGNVAITSISCRPNACPPGYSWQRGQGIAVDASGYVYVTGQTWSVDFPTQIPYQATNKSTSRWAAYVTKLNPTGTGLVYSTYLGGSGNDEADAIAIDASGNAYIVGQTFSGDFPTTPGSYTSKCPIQGGTVTYCETNGGSFLTKLSADGQSLVYSTYLTTLANSGTIRAVAVDSQGRAYVSGDNVTYGNSNSPNPPTTFFPTTPNALMSSSLVDQALYPGVSNAGMAFLTVFSADGSSLLYSTLFGDTNPAVHNDHTGDGTQSYTRASGVAVDPNGNFYLAGNTADPHIPVTPNAFQTTYVAFTTASRSFVAKFSPIDSPSGPQLIYSTYLGAMNTDLNASDQIAGIAVDASGSSYVTGYTQNPGFPTTPGTFNPGPCGAGNPGNICANGAFLTKFAPDGKSLAWSTLVSYATPSTPSISAILSPRLDSRGNVYVIVQAGLGYPAVHPVQTPTGNTQLLGITKFDPTGSKIFFSTRLGSPTGLSSYGSSIQFPGGIDVDPQGNIYVGGMTQGNDLPTTVGAFQTTDPLNSQNWTSFLAKINPFVVDTTGLVIVPPSANAGQTVTFTATVDTNKNGTATGTVNFLSGTTVLGTGTLDSNGTATFSTSELPPGTYSVTADYLGDDTYSPSTSGPQSLTVANSQAPQTITFNALPNVTYGVAPITLTATASSGLPVSYAVTGSATLSGSTLTITGPGLVTVTASQAGDANYTAATPVSQSFTVSPAMLTVTANSVSRQYGAANPVFTYTITGFVNGDSASVVSGTATETTTATSTSNAGTYPITFVTENLVAVDYMFNYVSGTLTVTGGVAQTITLTKLPNVTYGVGPITLTATASSGLPLSFAVTGPATLSGSTLTITGTGLVTVTASQAGSANYAAATPVSQSFTVSPAMLTVTANSVSRQYGAANPVFTYTITGFVNGDSASVVSGTATETTTATSTSNTGTYPITFVTENLVAVNYTFNYVSGTLTITGGAAQTITFNPLPNVTYGVGPITLTATASSGLPVSYSVTGPATLSGSTLTITGTGLVTVTASQTGNANYAAATPVSQSFAVSAVSGPNFTITPMPPAEFDRGVISVFVLQLKSVKGFNGNVTLSCSGGPTGSKCIDFPQTIKVNGTAFAISGVLIPPDAAPGTYTITFTGVSGSLTNTATAKLRIR